MRGVWPRDACMRSVLVERKIVRACLALGEAEVAGSRWLEARLYKGLASDARSAAEVGGPRLRRSLARSFAPPTRVRTKAAARRRAERLRRGAHGHARPLSGGFSTDDEARLSCGLAPDDDVRGPRSGHRFGEAKIARGTVPRASGSPPCCNGRPRRAASPGTPASAAPYRADPSWRGDDPASPGC